MSLAALTAIERLVDRTTVAIIIALGLALAAGTAFIGA